MLLGWVVSVARGACPDLVTPEAFGERLDSAWSALGPGVDTAFRSAVASLQADLGCLSAPLSPGSAAAFHRSRALVSADAGDLDGARVSAAAAARLAPEQVDAWSSVPRFAELLAAAPPSGPEREFTTSLAAGVWVDGAPRASRPAGSPVVVQVFAADGSTVGGAWVDGRSALPDWVSFPPVVCPAAVPVEALVRLSVEADAAFVRLDVPAFEEALRAVAVGLPCVDGPLGAVEAAAVHRLEGLRLYTLGAELGALRSFQESRLLDPSYVPSPDVIRPESTLERLWTLAGSLGAPPWVAMGGPPNLVFLVDGVPTTQRPATLPAIVQASSPGGAVLWTRYLPATVGLPELAAESRLAELEQERSLPPALRVYRDAELARGGSQRRQGLAVGGAALLFVSGLLYKTNANLLSDFHDPETPPESLERLQRSANLAAAASTTSAVLGLGLLGVTVVVD